MACRQHQRGGGLETRTPHHPRRRQGSSPGCCSHLAARLLLRLITSHGHVGADVHCVCQGSRTRHPGDGVQPGNALTADRVAHGRASRHSRVRRVMRYGPVCGCGCCSLRANRHRVPPTESTQRGGRLIYLHWGGAFNSAPTARIPRAAAPRSFQPPGSAADTRVLHQPPSPGAPGRFA